MFYYIDTTSTPSFPIEWVKTESDFYFRSVETETGLGWWVLLIAVISAYAYPFLAFSDLTCHHENTEIGVFWLHHTTWSSGDRA